MKAKILSIPEVMIIEPEVFFDDRGYFFESFNEKKICEVIGNNFKFVQDNISKSTKGVLRGLHYQLPPYEQGKLIRVVYGNVYDVVVDLRKKSPTFGKWLSINLSANEISMLWVPPGFAHGFLSISDEVIFSYKVTNYYNPESEITISFDDKNLSISWPNINEIFVSDKDMKGISISQFKNEYLKFME